MQAQVEDTSLWNVAIDLMAAISAETRMDGLQGLLAEASERLSLPSITVFSEAHRQPSNPSGYIVAHNADFMFDYGSSDLFEKDPVRQRAQNQSQPFQWSLDWHRRQPELASVTHAFESVGVDSGFMVPLFGPQGLRGTVGFGGRAADLADENKQSVLFMLSLKVFEKAEKFTEIARPPITGKPVLAPREIQCLYWTACGKTAWEIGEILGLSERTVESYLKTASLKLGAVTRTQAVALAIRQGFIL